ncbi:hypothetical protein NMY22_g18324 [Coprinellus aureogranulatus]|nr:hypothetical protein NMY22_g18324 [Coprinellus aureogranulatus]
MYHNNRLKLEGLAEALPKQLERAKEELREAEEHLENVRKSTEPADREKWREQLEKANSERKRNPKVNGYLPCEESPWLVTMQAVKAALINKEKSKGNAKQGVAGWVALAIEVQKAQIEHRALLLRHSKNPSVAESVDMAKKGQNLAQRVTSVFRQAAKLFPNIDFNSRTGRQWVNDTVEICVCEEECSCDDDVNHLTSDSDSLGELPMRDGPLADSDQELTPLPLPSSFDRKPHGWDRVCNLEEELRVAQANEALEEVRLDIGHKSFLYLENREWSTGKRERTRGYDRINAVESNLRSHIKKYESARWALHRLGLASRYPQFHPLTRADTRAVTAVYNPNKRGDRNAGMSWIWRRHVAVEEVGDGPSNRAVGEASVPENAYLAEVYRVKWLRAQSRVDRWKEEVDYLTSEMSWYVNFMDYQEKHARQRASLSGGRSAYELRQADIWRRYGLEARMNFGWVSDKRKRRRGRRAPKGIPTIAPEAGESFDRFSIVFEDLHPLPFSSDHTMVFSRDLFPLVRNLDAREYQSLLNYSSSRSRACANAFLLRYADMADPDLHLFLLALARELSTANALLGLGIMLFRDDQIRPPFAVRHLTPLLVQNRLTDWEAVSQAVKNGRDTGDDLLARYEQCWWGNFRGDDDIETFSQSPVDILRFWEKQKKNLPAPVPLPPVGLVQLQCLADDELDRAYLLASDNLKALDSEISDNQKFIGDITVMLLRSKATLRDLKAVEQRLIQDRT